jgi:hypothetical protein
MIDAVDGLVADAQARTRLGEQSRERVAEHYNPAQSLQLLLALYCSLLTRPQAVA